MIDWITSVVGFASECVLREYYMIDWITSVVRFASDCLLREDDAKNNESYYCNSDIVVGLFWNGWRFDKYSSSLLFSPSTWWNSSKYFKMTLVNSTKSTPLINL